MFVILIIPCMLVRASTRNMYTFILHDCSMLHVCLVYKSHHHPTSQSNSLLVFDDVTLPCMQTHLPLVDKSAFSDIDSDSDTDVIMLAASAGASDLRGAHAWSGHARSFTFDEVDCGAPVDVIKDRK